MKLISKNRKFVLELDEKEIENIQNYFVIIKQLAEHNKLTILNEEELKGFYDSIANATGILGDVQEGE